jgi:hypothetical protein
MLGDRHLLRTHVPRRGRMTRAQLTEKILDIKREKDWS